MADSKYLKDSHKRKGYFPHVAQRLKLVWMGLHGDGTFLIIERNFIWPRALQRAFRGHYHVIKVRQAKHRGLLMVETLEGVRKAHDRWSLFTYESLSVCKRWQKVWSYSHVLMFHRGDVKSITWKCLSQSQCWNQGAIGHSSSMLISKERSMQVNLGPVDTLTLVGLLINVTTLIPKLSF